MTTTPASDASGGEGIDIVGTPGMVNKVVVMDPKPLDPIARDPLGWFDDPTAGSMNTYVYDHDNQPVFTGNADSPGVPTTNRHVKLTNVSLDRFTQTTPFGAQGPTLSHNPFIGPNPLSKIDPTVPAGDSPGVTVSFQGHYFTGSFLFDTGAASSMISTAVARALNVQYVPGLEPSATNASPTLEALDSATGLWSTVANQFQLSISGIGGDSEKIAGFYLDMLSLPTIEGDPIRFIKAPVLVCDITLTDPVTKQSLTLDGDFGMNYLVASAEIIDDPIWPFGNMQEGPFNWIVYNEPEGILGLDVKSSAVPEPATLVLLAVGLAMLGLRRVVAAAGGLRPDFGRGL